jgi:hypothetical protein
VALLHHPHGAAHMLRQGLGLREGRIVGLEQSKQAIGRGVDHLDAGHRGGYGRSASVAGLHEPACWATRVSISGGKQGYRGSVGRL